MIDFNRETLYIVVYIFLSVRLEIVGVLEETCKGWVAKL